MHQTACVGDEALDVLETFSLNTACIHYVGDLTLTDLSGLNIECIQMCSWFYKFKASWMCTGFIL